MQDPIVHRNRDYALDLAAGNYQTILPIVQRFGEASCRSYSPTIRILRTSF